MIWEGRGFSFDCEKRTLIMGILNITPDSFSDGGKYFDKNAALERGFELVKDGADILDIGGESTRPGAEPVGTSQEIDRVCPIIEALAGKIDAPISIDTYKSEVALAAIKSGATIVNDISGLHFDENMAGIVAEHGTGIVLMHIKGTPKNMQKDPEYQNLFSEIILFLKEGIDRATEAGIPKSAIVLDPGIGFGKTLEHNVGLMGNLERFAIIRRPLLLGVSRKSFIGKIIGNEVNDRIFGSAAAVAVCIAKGAHIVRVHDVKQMCEVARVADALIKANNID